MPVTYNKPNRYDYISRKVFEKQIDRLERKLKRLFEELRVLEDVTTKWMAGQRKLPGVPEDCDCAACRARAKEGL